MAKYEDYADRKDELQAEIDDAGKKQEKRQLELPERFKNKTAEEIAESYVNLERKFNERNDTIGTLRRNVDELIALESVRQAQQPADEEESFEVSVDDFYQNPTETISRVAERASSKKIEALERQVAEANTRAAMTDFLSKHPKALDDAKSEEFQEWLKKGGYRQRLAQQADKYDFDAANDLFEMYYDSQGGGKSEERSDEDHERRERQLRDADAERGGAGGFDVTPKFSRREIVEQKIAAKQGDRAAEDWLKANNDAIAIAYAEGAVTD